MSFALSVWGLCFIILVYLPWIPLPYISLWVWGCCHLPAAEGYLHRQRLGSWFYRQYDSGFLLRYLVSLPNLAIRDRLFPNPHSMCRNYQSFQWLTDFNEFRLMYGYNRFGGEWDEEVLWSREALDYHPPNCLQFQRPDPVPCFKITHPTFS